MEVLDTLAAAAAMSQAAAKMKAVSRISLFGARTPADAKIELTVVSVSLTSKLAQRYDGKKVIVELDMPGQEDELKRSAAVVLKLGEAKVNWLCKYELGSSGSDNPVREALIAALLTDEDEDSEVLINVYGVNEDAPTTSAKKDSAAAKETLLGTAVFRLETILHNKQEVHGESLPVRDAASSQVGELTLTTHSLAAMTALKADAMEAAAADVAAKATKSRQVLVLKATELALDAKSPKALAVEYAALRCEVVGVPPGLLQPISCPALPLTDSAAALEFDATWPVPPGTALRTALMKARRQSSLKLRIYVDSVKKGGKATPLGTAEVDLSKSIDGLRDVEDEESELPILSLDKSPQVR